MSSLFAKRMSFFIFLLKNWIGLRNKRAGFPTSEPKLMKKPLALTNPKDDTIFPIKVMAKKPAIPKVLAISKVARRLAKVCTHTMTLLFIQVNWPAWSLGVVQSCKPLFLKTMQPILNRPSAMAKKLRNLITANAGTYHKYCMKTMIISRLFRSFNLLLYCNFDNVSILNLKLAHRASFAALSIADKLLMRNYL